MSNWMLDDDKLLLRTEQVQESMKEFKTGGKKDIKGKLRMDLIPPEAERAIAEVLTFGADKYSDRNWEKGIPLMSLYGAIRRHMNQFMVHNDIDEESGLHHLKHALCDLAMMVTLIERNRKDLDDRSGSNTNE